MSLRPPFRWTETVTAAGAVVPPAQTWPDATKPWPLSRSSTGGALHMKGVQVRGTGNLVYWPIVIPTGVSSQAITLPIPAPGWYELEATSIDPSTSCWPLDIAWGPLGHGGR
jgi:hypothetical protein